MKASIEKPQAIEKKILKRFLSRRRGSVLFPSDFFDLGNRSAIDLALHRLAAAGRVRRLSRGIYDYPMTHPKLGILWPSPEVVAGAIARRNRARIQPAGAYAANLLGLSEQVPARVIFLTDGPSKTVRVGPMVIQLRRTTPRNMAAAGRLSSLVIQALRHLGRAHVTPERIAHLERELPTKERKLLVLDIKLAPAWMHPILRRLSGDGQCD